MWINGGGVSTLTPFSFFKRITTDFAFFNNEIRCQRKKVVVWLGGVGDGIGRYVDSST